MGAEPYGSLEGAIIGARTGAEGASSWEGAEPEPGWKAPAPRPVLRTGCSVVSAPHPKDQDVEPPGGAATLMKEKERRGG